MPLIKGTLGTSERYGSIASMGCRILGTLHGLYALQAILDNVYEEVLKKLKQMDEDKLTTNLLLKQYCQLTNEEARKASAELESLHIDFTSLTSWHNSTHDKHKIAKAAITEYQNLNKNVGCFLKEFIHNFLEMEALFNEALGLVIKSVADRMTDQIVRIIDSQLVSPWSTLAASSLTDALSKRVQHYCLVDRGQNTEAQNQKEER